MVVVMSVHAVKSEVQAVQERIELSHFPYQRTHSGERVLFTIAAEPDAIKALALESYQGVELTTDSWTPLALVGRKPNRSNTVVGVGNVEIGAGKFVVMAGPCAVESKEQVLAIAEAVQQLGAVMLRGGAYKPRTSPYSFQGLGEEGLRYLSQARRLTGLPVVTEIMAIEQLEQVSQYADMLQIGARNMQNYALLQAVGEQEKPVLLKRGMSATITEWLSAAEYIAARGNSQIVLCERGIRTFTKSTRNTLDLSAVPVIKARSHLPIIVDPSHASGHWRLVEPLALAAAAVGADGLMIEVHNHPELALSDGDQSLTPENFGVLMSKLNHLLAALPG